MLRFFCNLSLALVTSSIIFTSDASASGPRLRPVTNQTARFQARMPLNITHQTIEGESLLDTEYRSTAQVNGATLEVRVRVLIPIKLDDQDALDLYGSGMVDSAEQQFIKAFGQPTSNEDVTQNGAKGKDFIFRIAGNRTRNGQEFVIRRRVLFDGQRLYQIIAEGSPQVIDSSEVSEFLDSVSPIN